MKKTNSILDHALSFVWFSKLNLNIIYNYDEKRNYSLEDF